MELSVLIARQLPLPPSPQPLAITILHSVSMNVTIRGSSCKWNYIGFLFLRLSIMSSSFIHMPSACVRTSFLFKVE